MSNESPMDTLFPEIAASLRLTEPELLRQALLCFLQEQKRQLLHLRLETLAPYRVASAQALESAIAQGTVIEHPAWETLIVSENLDARIQVLDRYVQGLQAAK